MPTITYLHGFLSSSQSFKAQATKAWLQQHHPDWTFHCPELSAYPQKTKAYLDQLIASQREPFYLIGSSMGGFWANYMVERTDARAVLVNPAVNPAKMASLLVGEPLKNYYTDEIYCLTSECVALLRQMGGQTPKRLEQYWLLVQTADETLDYTHAVAHYKGCEQTIIEGGSHAFDDYEQHLPAIMQFLLKPKQ